MAKHIIYCLLGILSRGKNCVRTRISLNKRFTSITKKIQWERYFLQSNLGYIAETEQGDTETSLALLIKSNPHEIAKYVTQQNNKTKYRRSSFSLLRNMEKYVVKYSWMKLIKLRFMLHLPMNWYQRMQRFMTNFEYDKHFFSFTSL